MSALIKITDRYVDPIGGSPRVGFIGGLAIEYNLERLSIAMIKKLF